MSSLAPNEKEDNNLRQQLHNGLVAELRGEVERRAAAEGAHIGVDAVPPHQQLDDIRPVELGRPVEGGEAGDEVAVGGQVGVLLQQGDQLGVVAVGGGDDPPLLQRVDDLNGTRVGVVARGGAASVKAAANLGHHIGLKVQVELLQKEGFGQVQHQQTPGEWPMVVVVGVGLLCLEKLAFFRGGGLGGASEPSGESPGVIGGVQVVELPSAIEWLPLLLPCVDMIFELVSRFGYR
ncbi:hypothetical protein TYRP_012881 [Tyrophagus putrescentiae]|nr:hypothetical protein TYRP_012881 [Tyrophagus putrescentiae]